MKIHSRIVLSLSLLALVTTACDPSPSSVALAVGPSSFHADATFTPTPLVLTPLGSAGCGFGSAFGLSFNLVITAGAHDLTMDSVTLQLLDGTHLGGPSVTIPSLQVAPQGAALFVHAGATRRFPLHADFGCVTGRPHSLRGNVLLFDPRGARQTMVIEGRVV